MKVNGKVVHCTHVMWFLTFGYWTTKMLLHSCPGGDNRKCINPKHLREGDHLDNARDRVLRGREYTTLTEVQVIEIRALQGKKRQREIAGIYGVSRALISLIHNRKIWTHI